MYLNPREVDVEILCGLVYPRTLKGKDWCEQCRELGVLYVVRNNDMWAVYGRADVTVSRDDLLTNMKMCGLIIREDAECQ